MPSSTKAAQGRKSTRSDTDRRYSPRFIMGMSSNGEMAGDTQMAAHHVDKLRVALRGPNRGGLTENPEQETREPQPQAETERRRQGAVEDRDRARSAAEQDVFGERAMNGCCKSGDLLHQTSAPPPKEKNERKKELAAKAIERPNTIWISRRKPPEVSPNASVRPVTMMMMTAMILATGPSTDCRIWFNGCSQGMLEPAACADAPDNAVSTVARVTRAAVVAMTRRMRNGRWVTVGLLRVKERSRRPARAR